MESKHEKTEKSVFKCENVCKEREFRYCVAYSVICFTHAKKVQSPA